MSAPQRPMRCRAITASLRSLCFRAVCTWLSLASSASADLATTRPQVFHRGPPPGAAVTNGVDWTRSSCASKLPEPETATVLWQQHLAGGLSSNLLVDSEGHIWSAGFGRVTQLRSDGSSEYSVPAAFSSALANTLLSDGTRVLLAREGALWAWSARGALRFQLSLGAGRNFTRASLLPLPNGAVLASVGSWLFQIGADGAREADAHLSEEAAATYVDAGGAWIVGAGGTIWSWDGREAPVARGALDGAVSAAVRGDPGHLLAIVAGRELVEWTLGASRAVPLASLPDPGPWPRIAISPAPCISVLGLGGVVSSAQPDQPLRSSSPEHHATPAAPHPGELLSATDGELAWLAPGMPLTLEHSGHTRVIEGVSCAQPASLAPAGSGRVVAGCKSGQIWLIGPSAAGPGDRSNAGSSRAPETKRD
jgi:hypothetical protein